MTENFNRYLTTRSDLKPKSKSRRKRVKAGTPYKIINGERVYGQATTHSGRKPKLGEHYSFRY